VRITVVGDTLLDEDIEGTATRLSPDAPVPVVDVTRRSRRAGGAGLVATMLARDGHEVTLVTALSDDDASGHLRRALAHVELVASPSRAPTPVKARLRAGGATVARIDAGCGPAPIPAVTPAMRAAVAAADVVVVADYGRGITAAAGLREELERRGRDVPVVWDPHPRGEDPVSTVRLVTPNLAEAAAAAQRAPVPEAAEEACRILRARWRAPAVVVTLGEHGALLLEEDDEPWLARGEAVVAADPCGAGDRFAATVATVLAEGGNRRAAVRAAIDAAGAYLAAGGVAALAG
jgi:rfaE bifunctional protein kinase chain/domain